MPKFSKSNFRPNFDLESLGFASKAFYGLIIDIINLFRKFKNGPKIDKKLRLTPLLFVEIWHFLPKFSKSNFHPNFHLESLGFASKAFYGLIIDIINLFRKFKNGPKIDKKLRLTPLLFVEIWHFLPKFSKSNFRPNFHLESLGFASKAFYGLIIDIINLFRKLKNGPKIDKKLRLTPLLFVEIWHFLPKFSKSNFHPNFDLESLGFASKAFYGLIIDIINLFRKFKNGPKIDKKLRLTPLLFVEIWHFLPKFSKSNFRPNFDLESLGFVKGFLGAYN